MSNTSEPNLNISCEQIFAEGMQLHQVGRLDEAEMRYRRIIEVLPQAASVWHALGILTFQRGDAVQAVHLIERAIALSSNNAEFYNNLGLMLHELKRYVDAERALRHAIALRSNYPEAYNNLGNTLKEIGSLEDACRAYRTAIQIQPDFSGAYNNLGVVYQKLGRWSDSVASLKQALQLQPDDASALYNLGLSLAKLDDFEGAIEAYRQALARDPADVAACKNLAKLLLDQGEWQHALTWLKQAIAKKPDYAEAWIDIGIVYGQLGDNVQARQAFAEALRLKPTSAEAHYNLGVLLLEANDYAGSTYYLERANNFQPGSADVELLRNAQYECDWEAIPCLLTKVLTQAAAEDASSIHNLSPFVFLTLPCETSSHQQCMVAERWSKRYLRRNSSFKKQQAASRQADSQLRIGYVSADFHDHATGWLIAELIEKHDRRRFEIYGYSNGHDDGRRTRQRLSKAFDHFRDIRSLSHATAAQAIADDHIDILVDLKGYTQHNRAEIFALRPAPIQVNYLGYPGTMGADFIDYILVDSFVVPPDRQPYYREKLVYLPGCYQANDATLGSDLVPTSRAACGLPDDAIVCCSFNSSYKLVPDVFQQWLEILRNAPSSVLWLLEQNPQVSDRLRQVAHRHGIAPDRLIFAPIVRHPVHLGRLALADLFLDSFPVSAHTTASDALRMGVPLLTRTGETFVSRVAGSLLHHLGLEELITASSEAYLRQGLELTSSRDRLLQLRQRVEARVAASDLWNGALFASKLEQAYLAMWSGNA